MGKKLGLIARSDNSGLGTLSLEFYENLKPYIGKIVIVQNGVYKSFPERFPGARVTHRELSSEDIDWLLEGVDSILTFETPYSDRLFREAKKRGVRSILIPMYECTPSFSAIGHPDLILCPSKLDLDFYKPEKKHTEVKYLPIPVNRKRLSFNQKRRAKTFLHNAGHGGLAERNGTNELLAAIPMVQSDVKFIINTQRKINYSHPKVEMRVGNVLNYWDLWRDGDVFVFPHKFDGLSLPIQEALSVGMPVLSTAIYPFTTFLPNEWFFNPDQVIQTKVSGTMNQQIDFAIVRPEEVAKKIDEFADKDIREDSMTANRIASGFDWNRLREDYRKLI